MLDHFRIEAYGLNIQSLLLKEKFNFKYHGDVKNGDIKSYSGKWKHLEIKIYLSNSYVIFKGSLHKYYCGNNYGQFTFSDFQNCLEMLNKDFGIQPKRTIIKRFEFGLNLDLDFDPKDIASRFIAYKRERFSPMKKGKNGIVLGSASIMDRWKIKIYSKSDHYGLKGNILRFEVVVMKMVQMHKIWKLKIKSLSDLNSRISWGKLGEILAKTYSQILLNEVFNESRLNKKELILHLRYRNPDSFERTSKKMNRNTYGNQIKRFKAIQTTFGDGLRDRIKSNIESTLCSLISRNDANAQLDNMVHLHNYNFENVGTLIHSR